MKAFAFAAVSALVASSYAATVKIEETACLQNTTDLESFDIEIGPVVVKELKHVCGLKIVSADGADVKSVKCQAFADAEGTQKGSAEFTIDDPALIATNPVQEGSIQCSAGDGEGDSEGSTTLGTVTASATGTGSGSSPTGNATVTVSQTPTQPGQTGQPSGSDAPGAAGTVGMSMGALAAAGFAALLL